MQKKDGRRRRGKGREGEGRYTRKRRSRFRRERKKKSRKGGGKGQRAKGGDNLNAVERHNQPVRRGRVIFTGETKLNRNISQLSDKQMVVHGFT